METSNVVLTKVHSVVSDGSVISWKSQGGDDTTSAKMDQLLFIVDADGEYIITILIEEANPSQLLTLSTALLPPDLLAYRITTLPPHLSDVDVLVSTKSGVGQSLTFWHSVLLPLWDLVERTLSVQTRRGVLITRTADSVREYASTARPQTTAVLLSGDGGVVDILNGCEGLTLALIPLGTANALFHSLHRPVAGNTSALVLGLRTLFAGVQAPLPVFRADFSPGSSAGSMRGAVVASYGFHASIVSESDSPEYRAYGSKRFGMVAKNLLETSHAYRANVRARRAGSWENVGDGQHGYVLLTPVSSLERTFVISPESRPLDGTLRMLHFGDVGGERTMDVMMGAYDGGKHVGMAWEDGHRVRYEEVDEVCVTTEEEDARWRKVCVDGTIVELPRGGHVSITMEGGSMFKVVVDPKVLSRPE